MNYARALATLKHARTGKNLPKKKLENATWLHAVVGDGGHERLVDLVLFDKHILTWHPNGDLALDTHGWMLRTTKDRYNKYLPSGFRVWQYRPFWFIKTPQGTLPFFNGMVLSPTGGELTLPDEMCTGDAVALQKKIGEYAQLYAARLVNGIISRDPEVDCPVCRHRTGETAKPTHATRAHILDHVKHETTPKSMVIEALNSTESGARCFQRPNRQMTRTFLTDVIYASWHENQSIWRRPKSKRALVARTEILMTEENLPRLDIVPRAYVVNIRMLIEDYILEQLCFERMPDE